MSIIVTDTGFAPDDWAAGFAAPGTLAQDASVCGIGIDLAADVTLADLAGLVGAFHRIGLIGIAFAGFADGRGFTLARHLRLLGYRGRLRARGHLIADQYAMARRSGFDEIEIDADLAARQPEEQWRFRSGWQSHSYQTHLGRSAAIAIAGPGRS